MRVLLQLVFLLFALTAGAGTADFAARIVPLIDPAKLATLASRGANPRVEKVVALLEDARLAGLSVEAVASNAVARAGYANAAAKLTRDALVRNHSIAMKLGCLTDAGLAEMRRGHSATITKGPYRGQEASVDHIIPRAVVPELD